MFQIIKGVDALGRRCLLSGRYFSVCAGFFSIFPSHCMGRFSSVTVDGVSCVRLSPWCTSLVAKSEYQPSPDLPALATGIIVNYTPNPRLPQS